MNGEIVHEEQALNFLSTLVKTFSYINKEIIFIHVNLEANCKYTILLGEVVGWDTHTQREKN